MGELPRSQEELEEGLSTSPSSPPGNVELLEVDVDLEDLKKTKTVARPDLEHQREVQRGRVADILLGILAFIVGGSFVSLWFGWGDPTTLTDVLTIVFAPIIGLVGAVTGFYYGEKYSSNKNGI